MQGVVGGGIKTHVLSRKGGGHKGEPEAVWRLELHTEKSTVHVRVVPISL